MPKCLSFPPDAPTIKKQRKAITPIGITWDMGRKPKNLAWRSREELITKQTLSVQASQKQSDEVYEQGSKVMPFDQNLTTHTFMPNSSGGIQTVTANDSSNSNQIKLIRSHLQSEAEKFQQGDFSSPAAVHGEEMPGLAELQSGGDLVDVQYKELPDGGRLVYSSRDSKMVAALHRWFNVQNQDHNGHENMNY